MEMNSRIEYHQKHGNDLADEVKGDDDRKSRVGDRIPRISFIDLSFKCINWVKFIIILYHTTNIIVHPFYNQQVIVGIEAIVSSSSLHIFTSTDDSI